MPDDPTLPSSPTPETSSGLAPNVGAGIACIFPLIGGIVMLLVEKKNEFIRYWAAQALIVGALMFVAGFGMGIIAGIFGMISTSLASLIIWVYQLAALALWIVMIVKAFTGKKWDIPVVSNFIPTVLGWFKTT